MEYEKLDHFCKKHNHTTKLLLKYGEIPRCEKCIKEDIEKKIEKPMFWTFSGATAILTTLLGIALAFQEETRTGGIIIAIISICYIGYKIYMLYK